MTKLVWMLLLASVYVIMTGSTTGADWILALVAALAVLSVCRLGRWGVARGTARRIAAVPRLVGAVLLELARGSRKMLRVLLGLDDWRHVGNVDVPLGERTDRGTAVSAITTTATPGSIVVDFDHDERVMTVNVIDATDPDQTRRSAQEFYEHVQKPVVP